MIIILAVQYWLKRLSTLKVSITNLDFCSGGVASIKIDA